MILIVSDMQDNPKEIRDFFVNEGLKVYIVTLDRFKENLKGKIDLIIYDTYGLHHKDIENIHMAKEMGIPIVLITAYPEKEAMEEISRLWRYKFIEDYLIRPVKIEKLADSLPLLRLRQEFSKKKERTKSVKGRTIRILKANYKYPIAIGVFSLFLIVGFKILIHTNKTGFCTSCHSMRFPYGEYKESAHYKSPSGVMAECADCHVPHSPGALAVAKMFVTKNVWAELTKDMEDKEEWEKERPRLARIVREKMLESDSATCRKCHREEAMVLTEIQGRNAHEEIKIRGETCIDCHYNLVHKKVPWPEKEETL